MDLTVEQLDTDTARVILAGRLDIAGSEAIDLRFTAVASKQRFVIVDMAEVSFLASIGIRALFSKAKALQGRGGKMVLVGPQPAVAQVLEVTGVPQLIPVFPDVAAARDYLAGLPA